MGAKIQLCCGATQRNVLSKVGLNEMNVAFDSIKCTTIPAKSKWRPPRWRRLMHEQRYLLSSLVVATPCSWDSLPQSYFCLSFWVSDLFQHAAQTHTQSPINQDARQTSEWQKKKGASRVLTGMRTYSEKQMFGVTAVVCVVRLRAWLQQYRHLYVDRVCLACQNGTFPKKSRLTRKINYDIWSEIV